MDSVVGRRALLGGLISLIAAPAIVRATSLMSIKTLPKNISIGIDFGRSEYTVMSILEMLPSGIIRVVALEQIQAPRTEKMQVEFALPQGFLIVPGDTITINGASVSVG